MYTHHTWSLHLWHSYKQADVCSLKQRSHTIVHVCVHVVMHDAYVCVCLSVMSRWQGGQGGIQGQAPFWNKTKVRQQQWAMFKVNRASDGS